MRRPKAKPSGRVPPDAILLSGNKSMQKCLLLAEGIYVRIESEVSIDFCGWEPALFCAGLIGSAFLTRWHPVATCPPNQRKVEQKSHLPPLTAKISYHDCRTICCTDASHLISRGSQEPRQLRGMCKLCKVCCC